MDNEEDYRDLPRPVQLNIKKDTSVKVFMSAPFPGLEPRPCVLHFPATAASLTIGRIQVTKRIRRALTTAYSAIKLQKYITRRNGWLAGQFDSVDGKGLRALWTGRATSSECEW